ncbi:MFS transporter, partial [Carnobacterium sp.]|uniref:MFS transporter n=1 Tax=Carnobacterium sp. TaxID=48221 RepID=UPI0028A731DA
MNNISKEKTNFELTPSFILLLAVSCGVAVASLYYIQPLESMLAVDFGVSVGNIGFAAMLTQIGYALGLFFIVPLGDIFERRSLIIRMLILVVISLIGVTVSRHYVFFAWALFIVGITSIVPQLIIPYAAQLSKPEKRGSVLGTVMGGLLIGILLSRTFSGMIGSVLGWRPVYLFATGLILLLLLIIRLTFPKSYPTTKVSYLYLLRSIPQLIKNQRVLQASAVNGFFMFGSFSVFWTSLIFLLESPEYHMGTREAGLVGLVGVVGALAAPIIGKFNDKGDPS